MNFDRRSVSAIISKMSCHDMPGFSGHIIDNRQDPPFSFWNAAVGPSAVRIGRVISPQEGLLYGESNLT